jgi:hypothetical protein
LRSQLSAEPGEFAVRVPYLRALSDWTSGSGSTLNSTGARTDHLYDHLLVWDLVATPELDAKAEVLDVRDWAASDEAFFDTVSDHLLLRAVLTLHGPDDD